MIASMNTTATAHPAEWSADSEKLALNGVGDRRWSPGYFAARRSHAVVRLISRSSALGVQQSIASSNPSRRRKCFGRSSARRCPIDPRAPSMETGPTSVEGSWGSCRSRESARVRPLVRLVAQCAQVPVSASRAGLHHALRHAASNPSGPTSSSPSARARSTSCSAKLASSSRDGWRSSALVGSAPFLVVSAMRHPSRPRPHGQGPFGRRTYTEFLTDPMLDGVVIDDTGLFNTRLKEWEDFTTSTDRMELSGPDAV